MVANQIPDQQSFENAFFQFQFAPNAFTDQDGDTLTYTATLVNDNPLPAWLIFDAATRTFSGTPPLDFTGLLALKVTASDGMRQPSIHSTSISIAVRTLNFTEGDDTYTASANGETINALGGNDNVTGGLGKDTMNGNAGRTMRRSEHLTDTGNDLNVGI